jgi:hypothetical protein
MLFVQMTTMIIIGFGKLFKKVSTFQPKTVHVIMNCSRVRYA